ncbi:hypothetical protein LP420_35330 [Massilia sp. B-10]|nr:hypothetical protein LP420_35330 [Massilia sp. B-10]
MSWRQKPKAALPSLAAIASRLPVYPGSWLFARGLSAVLAPQLLKPTPGPRSKAGACACR